ncbi:MAG: hypothetical protein P8046_04710 [Anaerolineales bacterium]|jgi:UDP-N-acetylmuramyl pentapeptide phosphotransferase/UDP-N-acetylglucosamine-1-phosphate transferase
MIKLVKNWKAKSQSLLMPYMGGIAMLALVVSFVLYWFSVPGVAFLHGVLIGFSIVGNLAFLQYWRKKEGKDV